MTKIAGILFLVYILIGFGSIILLTIACDYVSIDSYNYVMFHHWIILLVIASVQLVLVTYFVKQNPSLFKFKANRKTIGKIILLPLLFSLFFILNAGWMLFVDFCLPNNEVLSIKGIVLNKRIELRSGRGPKRIFFLSVTDTITTQNYYFEVKKFIYDKYERNDVFVKEFNVSKLGMIYRKNE